MPPRTCAGCGGQFADIEEHLAGDKNCPAARSFQRKIFPSQSRYPREGSHSDLRCPQCGSSDVCCELTFMEFSTLRCDGCGFKATVDDYQITDWFPD